MLKFYYFAFLMSFDFQVGVSMVNLEHHNLNDV